MTSSKVTNIFIVIFLILSIPFGAYAQDYVKEKEEPKLFLLRWVKSIKGDKSKKIELKEVVEDSVVVDKEKRRFLRFNWDINLPKVRLSMGTNLLTWASFGTANLELNASLGNHVSLFAGGKYNPFDFNTKAYKEIYSKQTTGYFGVKWWPWYVNSGWWIGLKGQYSDFSTTGVLSSYLKEGVGVGGGLSGGYSFMLGKHFNLDLGLGIWGGKYLEYVDYSDMDGEKDIFVKLDNIIVSFIYFF